MTPMRRITLALCALLAPGAALAQQPLTLRQCIERAVERNVQVRQAQVAQRQQEVALSTARNAWLPEVGASVGQNLSFGRGLTASNTYESRNTTSTSLALGASVPLYSGGRLLHQREQARLNLAAATAETDRLRENLALQITQAYLQALYCQDVVTQSEANLRLAQTQEERVGQAIAAGRMAEVELAEATARVAQDQLALVQAQNNERLALLDLSQLLEFSTPDSLRLVRPAEGDLPPITGSPEEIYQACLPQRPALQAAGLRLQAAEKAIDIARSGYLPSVTLNANLGTNYYNTSGFANTSFARQMKDNFAQAVGLSLSVPLFNRHATRNGVRSARLEAANQRLMQEDARKALYKEIQTAFYNARAAEQKHQASTAALEAAAVALATVTKKYENGRANATEFDEARHKHHVASIGRLSARYEYLFRAKILDLYRGQEIR